MSNLSEVDGIAEQGDVHPPRAAVNSDAVNIAE